MKNNRNKNNLSQEQNKAPSIMPGDLFWWGRLESNRLPRRYEHPALTDELRPRGVSSLQNSLTANCTGLIIAHYHLLGYNYLVIIMKKINIRRTYNNLSHKYLTLNNVVLVVGIVIATGWVSGSLDVMQRNYTLQKKLEDKSRQLTVAKLDAYSSASEQRYYKTEEYKELAVRQRLGLGSPGESVLILSKDDIDDTVETVRLNNTVPVVEESNFKQWLDFLLGNNIKNISQ